MSDGYVHGRDAIVVGIGLVAGSLLLEQYYIPSSIVGVSMGAFAGIVFTPDSDLPQVTWGEGWLKKVPLVGWYIITRTIGYSVLFPVHRGISHVPIIGTATRFLYALLTIGWDLAALCYLADWTFPALTFTQYTYCFLAWCIQDCVHIWRDYYGS